MWVDKEEATKGRRERSEELGSNKKIIGWRGKKFWGGERGSGNILIVPIYFSGTLTL